MVQRLASHARRNLVAYVALVAALAAVGGVAYSSIPDAQGVIHGCYDNSSGALRVIDTAGSDVCRGGETALDWNQQGQPGPTGHTGLPGPPGVARSGERASLGARRRAPRPAPLERQLSERSVPSADNTSAATSTVRLRAGSSP